MKKLIIGLFTILLLTLISVKSESEAATYYVRTDGGTPSQCSGLVDSPYVPSTSNIVQGCALKHPFFVLAPPDYDNKLVGGDTMIINYGQYMMGYGAPGGDQNWGNCYNGWTWDCMMRSIPSGTLTNPTRILGKGWDMGCVTKPQLWATERPWTVLTLANSDNVEIQCLEITDHSDCIQNGPRASKSCVRDTYPHGTWGNEGIYSEDSENVLLKNLWIHGLQSGIHAGRLKNWIVENVDIINNAFVGWNGDIGAGISSNSGTITFKNTKINGNGCGETYPGNQPYDCWSQDQGGYGDGLGTHETGGNWIFDNVDISHNTSDGLDLLYHNGNGKITITNSRVEGNAGNQVKVAASTDITNSKIIGNCDYFNNNLITYTPVSGSGNSQAGFNHCRAYGSTIALSFKPGMKLNISQSTVTGRGDEILLAGGDSCNGTESITSINSIYSGHGDFTGEPGDLVDLLYNSGNDGNGNGPCGNIPFNISNSLAWNFKHGSPVGINVKYLDPQYVGPLLSDNWIVTLKSTSPALGWGYNPNPSSCMSNGTCSAATPVCGQTTTGIDNCGAVCNKVGQPCVCVSDGSCSAPNPSCGEVTTGINNCGTICTKQGLPCCISDPQICNAPIPACGQITDGVDNCNVVCHKVGITCPPSLIFTSISSFEYWLNGTTIKQADTTTVIKGVKTGSGSSLKYYKITIEKTTP